MRFRPALVGSAVLFLNVIGCAPTTLTRSSLDSDNGRSQTLGTLLNLCAKMKEDTPVHLAMIDGVKAKNGYPFKASYDGFFRRCNLDRQEISIADKPRSESVTTVDRSFPLLAIATMTVHSSDVYNNDTLLSE